MPTDTLHRMFSHEESWCQRSFHRGRPRCPASQEQQRQDGRLRSPIRLFTDLPSTPNHEHVYTPYLSRCSPYIRRTNSPALEPPRPEDMSEVCDPCCCCACSFLCFWEDKNLHRRPTLPLLGYHPLILFIVHVMSSSCFGSCFFSFSYVPIDLGKMLARVLYPCRWDVKLLRVIFV